MSDPPVTLQDYSVQYGTERVTCSRNGSQTRFKALDTNHASSDVISINPYPTAFPYGNGMVLHFYQQQESSTTKTVHKVINKGLKTYV